MKHQATVISLEERAEAFRQKNGDNVRLDDITSVVSSLVQGTGHDDGIENISHELRELLRFIEGAKEKILGIQPKSVSNRDIPDANIQLDAVVEATEEAASNIMDAAEVISEIAESVDDASAVKLEEVASNLFQASSFQDLTGQRITKVTRTLNYLEERLNSLADAIGDEFIAEPEDEIEVDSQGIAVNDDDLLHGPQLEGEGNSQDEIDAILASFD